MRTVEEIYSDLLSIVPINYALMPTMQHILRAVANTFYHQQMEILKIIEDSKLDDKWDTWD